MILEAQEAFLTTEGGTPIPFFTQRFLAPRCWIGPYAHAAWGGIGGFAAMKLLVFYIVFVAIGEAIAYVAGRTVEVWSPATSLPVFLSLFFFMLWAAWRLAVKVP
ncbi:MAG TPA: hypothetical protein VFL68_15665 [Pseudolabrys sp.]|jgi:hypothetical protein|nr:hypothetical protein [Pseudolabrys sp.]